MRIVLWVGLALLLNALIGAAVWAAIDDDRQSLFRWYDSAPGPLGPMLQFLILQAWPVGLWLWRRGRHPGAKG